MRLIAFTLSFYLFIGSLFPLMDFSQMAKVANLWQHYKLHQAEVAEGGESIGFASFWAKHYLKGDQHSHSDGHGHQNLPLTQINCGGCFLPSKHLFPKFYLSNTFLTQHIADDNLPPFDLFQSVFRPPIA